jgi:hypothetical protein
MNYRVTYAIDSLDPNPVVQEFETECEAVEFLIDEVNRRVEFVVAHSAYEIDESEFDAIVETEYSLARIDRL